jgi:hypothetical protein
MPAFESRHSSTISPTGSEGSVSRLRVGHADHTCAFVEVWTWMDGNGISVIESIDNFNLMVSLMPELYRLVVSQVIAHYKHGPLFA